MEDNEDAESTKSEVKLGKLQFSLDYDFQKGEVRGSQCLRLLCVCVTSQGTRCLNKAGTLKFSLSLSLSLLPCT